jgi:hypothetical protein
MSLSLNTPRPRHTDLFIWESLGCASIKFVSAKAKRWAMKYIGSTEDQFAFGNAGEVIESFEKLGMVIWFDAPLSPAKKPRPLGRAAQRLLQEIREQLERWKIEHNWRPPYANQD